MIIVSGTYDIIAEVVCRDQHHLLQFLTERLKRLMASANPNPSNT
ncbi:MAG: hypothetical protein D4R46_02290 [Chloroflexi bacterium]|nr:MAG: hypothetical protein D4R46_02290 [Chloroflexota bacterium]